MLSVSGATENEILIRIYYLYIIIIPLQHIMNDMTNERLFKNGCWNRTNQTQAF
jgi:hypothetical protein